MSILGTTANYTVTVHTPTPADDPFEIVQGAHFMQLLLAQLRPQKPLNRVKGKDVLEQLDQIDLLLEENETVEPREVNSPAG